MSDASGYELKKLTLTVQSPGDGDRDVFLSISDQAFFELLVATCPQLRERWIDSASEMTITLTWGEA